MCYSGRCIYECWGGECSRPGNPPCAIEDGDEYDDDFEDAADFAAAEREARADEAYQAYIDGLMCDEGDW